MIANSKRVSRAKLRWPIDTQNQRLLRWATLGLCLTPLLGSCLYAWGVQMPDGPCLFQRVVGLISPSCGLTRSFVAIARGDIATALTYHAFGPLLFGLFLATAIHTTAELISHRSLRFFYTRYSRQPWLWAVGGVLFLGYYLVRLYARYGQGQLSMWGIDLTDTALWQVIRAGSQLL